MSQPPSDSEQTAPAKVGVDAIGAGAGSGTLVFVIAQTLPDPFKFWLTAAAPTISAASSAGWVLLRSKIVKRYREWEMKQAIARAKQTLQRAIENEQTSEEHKATLRRDLEELELLEVRSDLDVARALIKKRETEHK